MVVKVIALGASADVELPEGSTVADILNDPLVGPNIPADANARVGGDVVAPADRASKGLREGDTVVFTAPELKHG